MSVEHTFIPVNEPLLDDADIEAAIDALRSGWISSAGDYIGSFENAWAGYCEQEHGIAVTSGTAALQIAVAALGMGSGDEIIMPSLTIISCATAAVYAGARPVFVDVDPQTWCMDVEQVGAAITSRTRAIMPVHLYGHPVDMAPIEVLARRHGLYIIEDAAEAHGARYRERPCGSFGDIACFSFYANKLITTGEGGMALTRDAEIASSLRKLRNLGFESDRRFRHEMLGHNFRMTNVQAALGVSQVSRLEGIVERKRWIAKRYTEAFSGVSGLELPAEKSWARSVYWMYGLVLNGELGLTAAAFTERLRRRGVDTRPFFYPLHMQPALGELGLLDSIPRPVSERLGTYGLYLPSGNALSDDAIDRVADSVMLELARL